MRSLAGFRQDRATTQVHPRVKPHSWHRPHGSVKVFGDERPGLSCPFYLELNPRYQSLKRISKGSSSQYNISSPAMILRTSFTLCSLSLAFSQRERHTHILGTHARTRAYSQVFQPPLLHDKRFDDLESVGMLPSRSLLLYHICEMLSSSSNCFPHHPRVQRTLDLRGSTKDD
jgi:hypothetical protein